MGLTQDICFYSVGWNNKLSSASSRLTSLLSRSVSEPPTVLESSARRRAAGVKLASVLPEGSAAPANGSELGEF